ncbi:MAG: nicotinate (nicotinamide) nucleotide adenylyltransferase [Alteromonadaceae bacterium]|nr:nicotinate (nicotinamide) nucleotide adenylyltransferase [Alteromonadaceae bacterium]
MKIVFGGTFNPVHFGHIKPLLSLCEEFGFAQIGLMPNFVSPFKQGECMVSNNHRINMLEKVIAEFPKLYLIRDEIDRECVSYTADTIQSWRDRTPEEEIVFVMGADSYQQLHHWYDVTRLLEQTSIIVLPRDKPVQKNNNLAPKLEFFDSHQGLMKGHIYLAQTALYPISSTQIRQAIQNNQDCAKYLPKGVLNYIQTHHLYQHHN